MCCSCGQGALITSPQHAWMKETGPNRWTRIKKWRGQNTTQKMFRQACSASCGKTKKLYYSSTPSASHLVSQQSSVRRIAPQSACPAHNLCSCTIITWEEWTWQTSKGRPTAAWVRQRSSGHSNIGAWFCLSEFAYEAAQANQVTLWASLLCERHTHSQVDKNFAQLTGTKVFSKVDSNCGIGKFPWLKVLNTSQPSSHPMVDYASTSCHSESEVHLSTFKGRWVTSWRAK